MSRDRERFSGAQRAATKVSEAESAAVPPVEQQLPGESEARAGVEPPLLTPPLDHPALEGPANPEIEAAPRYFMAPDKAVTSLRGLLSGTSTEVFAKDFLDGQATLDHLVSVGAVLKQ